MACRRTKLIEHSPVGCRANRPLRHSPQAVQLRFRSLDRPTGAAICFLLGNAAVDPRSGACFDLPTWRGPAASLRRALRAEPEQAVVDQESAAMAVAEMLFTRLLTGTGPDTPDSYTRTS